MNRLIEILKKEKNVTPEKLKRIYRKLCKQTHPDTAKGTHDDFIRLRKEYEEALKALPSIHAGLKNNINSELPHPDAHVNVREAVMEKLYLFSMRLFGSDGESALLELIEAADHYRKDVSELWNAYYASFYKTRKKWMDSGDVFYTHNLFISSIKQLFYYYSGSSERYKVLLLTFLQDLEKRMDNLDEEQARVIRGLSEWLRQEAELEKIVLF